MSETENENPFGSEKSSLAEDIHEWAISHRITKAALNDILKLFEKHDIGKNSLPKDYCTLMKTPRAVNSLSVGGGECIYFGIKNCHI